MPRNASGTYTLPAGNPVEAGTLIEASWANSTLEDIGNEITNSLSRDGEGGMLAPFRLADGTLGAPGIAWLNEPSTGFYRAGTGEMWGVVQGVQVLQYTANGVLIPSGRTFTAQGNASIGGTLAVTGATTLTGALAANGGVSTTTLSTTGLATLDSASVTGNLSVGGTLVLTGGLTLNGNVTVGDSSADTLTINSTVTSDLKFTDNTYDIGKSGATRPRDLFLSRNASVAGTLGVTGAATLSSTLAVTGAITATGGVVGNVTGNADTATALQTARTIWGQSFNGTANVSGALTGVTDLTASGNGSFGGTFGVTGNTTLAGSLALTGTAKRITGDFTTTSPISDRVIIQSSTMNGNTAVTIMPNGSAVNSSFFATNNSDPTNASTALMRINASEMALISGTTGSGTYLPMVFLTNNTERMRVFTSGGVSIGNTTDPGATNLSVTGSVAAGSISTAGAVTLSGGTANGVLYLNGSKVATSGSALTFDGTTVANINSDGTGFSTQSAASNFSILRLGTDSVNGYAFFQSGKSGTGTTLPFSWRQDSSELMRLTSTGLGIGTSSPSQKLDVNGSANISSRIYVTTGTAALPAYSFGGWVDTGIYNPTGTSLGFSTNGSERMRLDSSGNLGLATTSPANGITYNANVRVLGIAGSGSATSASYGAISLTNNRATPSGSDDYGKISFGSANNTGPEKAYIYATAVGSGGATGGYGANLVFATRADNAGLNNNLTLTSSGNLGLGVTPSAWTYSGVSALQVKNAGFAGLNNNAYVTANAYINSSGSYTYISTDYATYTRQTAGRHEWYNAPSGTAGTAITFTQAMTLDASGNLGVGTSSPAQRLEIAAASPRVRITDTDGGYAQIEADNGNLFLVSDNGNTVANSNLTFGVDGTERARIDSSGNLLVGTTTSTTGYRLKVSDTTTAAIRLEENGAGQKRLELSVDSSGNAIISANQSAQSLQFQTVGSERMRIDSSGNLLVGKTVNNTTASGTTIGKFDANVGAVRNVKTASGTFESLQNYYNGTYVGGVTYSDTATALATSSDERLKKNIVASESALPVVAEVSVKAFDWKINDEHQRYGFIAQELLASFPESVIKGSDEQQTLAVDNARFVPVLVKAIQEQQAIIDQLKARLDAANL